jgi:hypothetical protein
LCCVTLLHQTDNIPFREKKEEKKSDDE